MKRYKPWSQAPIAQTSSFPLLSRDWEDLWKAWHVHHRKLKTLLAAYDKQRLQSARQMLGLCQKLCWPELKNTTWMCSPPVELWNLLHGFLSLLQGLTATHQFTIVITYWFRKGTRVSLHTESMQGMWCLPSSIVELFHMVPDVLHFLSTANGVQGVSKFFERLFTFPRARHVTTTA